jgi:hypothetical protein
MLAQLRDGGTITFKAKGKTWTGPVTHGILSGWFITAAIDTLLNGTEWMALCKRAGFPPKLTRETTCFQGDDVIKVGGGYLENCKIASEYQKTLDVHPSKFWISTSEGEFLRNVFGWDHNNSRPFRYGYVARSIPSMLYAQRWSNGMMNARSIADSWSSLASRSGNVSASLKHCLNDLAGYFGSVDHSLIRSWFATPTALGGAGLMPYSGGDLIRCTEHEMGLKKNEYEAGSYKTEAADLSTDSRLSAIAFGKQICQILKIEAKPLDCVDTLVGALQLKKGKELPKQKLEKADLLGPLTCVGVSGVPDRPKFVMDPIYHTPLLRSKIRERDLAGVCALFDACEAPRISDYHKNWSRSVWIDWLCGTLPKPTVTQFGFASDVCAFHAVNMCWPSGKVTSQRVRACAAAASCSGRQVLLTNTYLHGMCA